MSTSALARKYGLNPTTVFNRLGRGWDLDDALETPAGSVPPRHAEDDPDLRWDILAGESSARQLAERHGVSWRTIARARKRLRAQGLRVRVPGGA